MHSTITCDAAAILATFAASALASCALSQTLLLNEVRADAGGRWIELHNRGAHTVDLSQWTIFYASLTPNMPQTYWWPFPLGTTLAPNGYLRVHWFQAAPAGGAAPGDLWTGNTPWNFLWGLGGEQLLGQRGALGLLRSQDPALMSSPNVVEDWLVWGQTGFSRELMATGAGLWSEGRFAPAIPAGQSLARDVDLVDSVAFEDQAWHLDTTPTPLATNQTGAVVQTYGVPCTLPGNHLLGGPLLGTSSPPLLGNAQFALTVDNTTGLFGEFVLVGFSTGAGPANAPSILPPFAGNGCSQAIDATGLITTWLLPAQIVSTTVPLSLQGVPSSAIGCELHAQVLVLDLVVGAYPPYQGVTNALRLVIGQ